MSVACARRAFFCGEWMVVTPKFIGKSYPCLCVGCLSIVVYEFHYSPRTQSNISLSASSSRVSPSVMENYENFESFDFPPFVEAGVVPHDILDRTNEVSPIEEIRFWCLSRSMVLERLFQANFLWLCQVLDQNSFDE